MLIDFKNQCAALTTLFTVLLLVAAGMSWPYRLSLISAAAYYGREALLRWLYAHGCPAATEAACRAAAFAGNLQILKYLSTFPAVNWTPSEL
jgi:hypothetical protein